MTCCIMATRLRTMLPHGGTPPPEEAGLIPNRPSLDMKGSRRRRHTLWAASRERKEPLAEGRQSLRGRTLWPTNKSCVSRNRSQTVGGLGTVRRQKQAGWEVMIVGEGVSYAPSNILVKRALGGEEPLSFKPLEAS